MSNPGPQRGWKTKRDKAAANNAAYDERAAVRAERQRMAQDLIDASNAAAAENAKLQARARCSCPVCDSGPVDVELAARVITALARMPAHVQTDPSVLATLNTIVSGRDIDLSAAYSTNLGLHRPHKVYAPVPLAEPAANTPQEAPVIPTKRRKPTAAEIFAAGGDEGALDLTD